MIIGKNEDLEHNHHIVVRIDEPSHDPRLTAGPFPTHEEAQESADQHYAETGRAYETRNLKVGDNYHVIHANQPVTGRVDLEHGVNE